ncbi:MAG: ABC transporter substrate-binding protein [Mycobacteriales bacterium]
MPAFNPPISRRSILSGAGGVAALAALGATAGCGSGGSKDLSQWYHQYGEDGTKQAAMRYASDYKKAKKVGVKVQWTPGDYATVLSKGLLGNKGPDCFESQLNYTMVKSKQIIPLDDIIDPVKSDFNPSDLAPNTIDGKVYGIKMIDDPQIFYYRKSMFTKAGVQVPATLNDLVATAKKLTSGKVKGIYAGAQSDSGLSALTTSAIFASGHTNLTADNKDVDYDNDDVAEAISLLHQIRSDKSVLTGAATDWTNPQTFLDGKCAIQWCGLWAMPQIQKALNDDFGIFAFPAVGSKGKQVVYNGGWTQFVAAKSKKQSKAKDYVKWLWIEQSALQEDWSLSYGFHIPPRKSLAAKAKKLQSGPPADVVKLANEHGFGDNPYWTPDVGQPQTDAVTNIVLKGKDAKKELDAAAKKSREALKKQ